MTTCCTRRGKTERDGIIDGVAIDRAVRGQHVKVSADEARIVFWRMASEYRWGPGRIAQATGYSKSHVAAELAKMPGRNR